MGRPNERMSLVTSARFAQGNGRGREGEGADRQAVERSKTARWSRRWQWMLVWRWRRDSLLVCTMGCLADWRCNELGGQLGRKSRSGYPSEDE
jgi:hypothetical protein